jgi:Domain of unknown function (DUF5606)
MIDLKGIISISGMPGLYKVVAQSKNGVIVESISDKKRFPAFASHKISSLEDISMFTTGDDKPIAEILKSIFDKENGGPCLDSKKEDKEIIEYFSSVLPEYDKVRVYVSNMRKLFSWYNQLQSTGNLKIKEAVESEDSSKNVKLEETSKTEVKKPVAKAKIGKTQAGNRKTAGVRKSGAA